MEDIIIYDKRIHSINLNNSGTMNQDNLDFAKRTMLFDLFRDKIDLIKSKQGYPNNDISEVELTIDCVVVNRKRYKTLVELESKNVIDAKLTIDINQEYLKFPNL